MSWDTATDIGPFGAIVNLIEIERLSYKLCYANMMQLISILYGGRFHIFKPDVPIYHEDYEVKIIMKHNGSSGSFSESYEEIAD